jgi:hypothetical protein
MILSPVCTSRAAAPFTATSREPRGASMASVVKRPPVEMLSISDLLMREDGGGIEQIPVDGDRPS